MGASSGCYHCMVSPRPCVGAVGKKTFKLIFFFVCFKLARGSSKAVTFMGKKALFSSLVRMSSLLK